MGDTVHVTVRLPADLMAEIAAEAKREQRSIAWVMSSRLRAIVQTPGASAPISGDGRRKRTGSTREPDASAVRLNVGDSQTRPKHDPGTCRIYRCGMCAAMKEK